MMRMLYGVLAALALLGCDLEVGERCDATGDGFTRRDPCEGMCVEWAITCPDGREVEADECAGEACQADADCADELICLRVDDFNSRCMRAALCE